MSGENDQARWVGVRPTNPAENIPVTESSPITALDVTEQVPLTQIKVEPLAAGTEFKTLTEKRSPAIADLQAIKSQLLYGWAWTQGGASDVTKETGVVPSGEIWVVSLICSSNVTGTTSHQYHVIDDGSDDWYLNGVLAPSARDFLFTQPGIVLHEGDSIKIVYGSLSAGAYAVGTVMGHKIGLY